MISKEELAETTKSLMELIDDLCLGDIDAEDLISIYNHRKPVLNQKLNRLYTGKSYDEDDSYCKDVGYEYDSKEDSRLRERAIVFARQISDRNAETKEVLQTADKIYQYLKSGKLPEINHKR